MGYDHGEETINKLMQRAITKTEHNNEKRQNTRNMRYLRIPPPQNKYLVINILKNTLRTHLTKFKEQPLKAKIEPLMSISHKHAYIRMKNSYGVNPSFHSCMCLSQYPNDVLRLFI